MQTDVWSTSNVPDRRRFDYWREVICEAVLNVDARPTEGGAFDACLSANRMQIGNFVQFRSRAHQIVRTQRLLRAKPDDRYLISLQLSGACHVEQGDQSFTLRPGDIGIVNAARPMRLAFERDVERVVAVVPRRTIEAACGWLSPNTPVFFSKDRPLTRIVSQLIREMATPAPDLSAQEQAALGRTLLELIATGNDGRRLSSRAEAMRARLVGHLLRHLSDPGLSPGSAAAALGISERMVHTLFAASGTTCQRWVIEQRLARAAAALRAPEWAGCGITEIAFRQGFSDLSHFSRRFKDRYGRSPRAYREERKGR